MKWIFSLLTFSFLSTIFSQNADTYILDSLRMELSNAKNTAKQRQIAISYLENIKAFDKNSELKIDAFLLASQAFSRTDSSLLFADSATYYASIYNKIYLSKAYLRKAIEIYYQRDYPNSADLLFKAKKSNRSQNVMIDAECNHYIALLHNYIDEENFAFNVFKNNIELFKDSKLRAEYPLFYFKTVYAFIDALIRKGKYNKAFEMCKEGLEQSRQFNNLFEHELYSSLSTCYLGLDKPLLAIKILDSVFTNDDKIDMKVLAENHLNFIFAYSSIGRCDLSENHFLKLQEIYSSNQKIISYYYQGLAELTHCFADQNSTSKAEKYEKLGMKAYHEFNSKKMESLKRIQKNEVEEIMIKEKTIKSKFQKKMRWFGLVLLITLIFSSYILYNNWRNQIQFKRLINSIEDKKDYSIPIQVSQKTEARLLEGLDKFEKSKIYLKQNYSLKSLSDELNTNSAYLSRVINDVKGLNFRNYINRLRINYIISDLNSNPIQRVKNLASLAEEYGFNNTKTFSRAFYKNTGVTASYFIKKLEMMNKNITN